MRWLFRTDFRSFYLLNATQFLAALNDNVYKLLVIYLLIAVKGPSYANTVLSLAGAIFVIPFLLFSSGAGVLADRISKRNIIVFSRILELAVLSFAFLSVCFTWEIGLYAALFLMATLSAIFGPSKYGIIPELVQSKMVSKANGSLTSLTYLAIILGTFIASFLTKITDKNFVVVGGFCLLISVMGLCTSLGIKRTEPKRSTKKINPFFLYEIYQTLRVSWHIPHLLTCIFGSSFFLFIGAFTQLNIIPFAMQALGLSDVGGGFLFLATAIGIAIGAVLSGMLAKDKVEPGISCIAGFFIGIFFILLSIFSSSLTATIIILALLGIVGGAYLIPFDSYLQVNSPDEKRGQIIAAANFFSFVGVLLAAVYLYFVSEELGLSASDSFFLAGVLSLIANFFITGRLSSLFFPFFANKILKRFRRVQLLSPPPDPSAIILLQGKSWWDAILLFAFLPKLKILLPAKFFRKFPWVNGFADSVQITPLIPLERGQIEKLKTQIAALQAKDIRVCLFIHRRSDAEALIQVYTKALHMQMLFVHLDKKRVPKSFLGITFQQKHVGLTLSKQP